MRSSGVLPSDPMWLMVVEAIRGPWRVAAGAELLRPVDAHAPAARDAHADLGERRVEDVLAVPV